MRGVAIAGPTASGKSQLALALAARLDGVIINADAMQVYRDLAIVTARPVAADVAAAPHRLYGVIDAADPFSAKAWTELAVAEIARARAAGKLPILVGGSGLYFKALFSGLAALPEIPEAIRMKWREVAAREGSAAIHAELLRRDPVMANRLRAGDTQRLTRALEVIDATGVSLADFQRGDTSGVESDKGWRLCHLDIDRKLLHERIAARVGHMIARGAVNEVAKLMARRLNPDLPAMRAIGVRELAAAHAGEILLAEAKEQMIAATRRYAKRQATWMRTQMPHWRSITADNAFP